MVRIHGVLLHILVCGLLLMQPEPSHAQYIFQLDYTGHVNRRHDAGSDFKHMMLQTSVTGAQGDVSRYWLTIAALTPPNGQNRPYAGHRVNRTPSNQEDTYTFGVGASRQRLYGMRSVIQYGVTVGMINGLAESAVRGSVNAAHRMTGMKNLRASPTSSDGRILIDLILDNANKVHLLGSQLSFGASQALRVGTLKNTVVFGTYAMYGGRGQSAVTAGIQEINATPAYLMGYIGLYHTYVANDVVTRHAGTISYVPYLAVGMHGPIGVMMLSLSVTYYPSDLVKRQYSRTDNYLKIGIGYRF